MTAEIATVPCIMKVVERSYCTPPGWRLATVEEAKHNLEMIKQQEWEFKWERARLLDGWISGSSYNFQIGDDFRIFLGHMLVIQIQGNSDDLTRSIYADVTLTDGRGDVALLLCVYDWNYEVVYWLLNRCENRDTFNLLDVREGNIPLRNTARFVQMNRLICHLCRILGEEGLAAQKAARRKPSEDSVREIMFGLRKSCWDKLSKDNQKILSWKVFIEQIDTYTQYTIDQCSEVDWFRDFASQGDTSDAIWNFLWHYIFSLTLVSIVRMSLYIVMEEFNSDLIMSTTILYYLVEYEEDVLKRNVEQVCKDAAGDDRQRFYATLENTSSAHYDETGDYHVLNRILIYAMKRQNNFWMIKVLEWGTLPQPSLGLDCFTALFFVIRHNGKEIMRILFDKCESKEQLANAADDGGKTALHVVCECEYADVTIVEMILQYGGKPDVPDKTGRLPLHYAVIIGKKEIVRILFDKCNSKEQLANAADDEGKTALHRACSFGDVSIVEMILQYGGKPEVPDKTGRLPLHYAVDIGRREIVRSLFDRSDSKEQLANAADDEGKTALHRACSFGDLSIVEIILQHGGKLDVLDKTASLPLHYAVRTGQSEIVRSLFDKCHSKEQFVNAANDQGMTALHVACRYGDVSTVEMILQYGGKLDVLDKTGRLPLHHAMVHGREDIVDVLIGKGNSDAVQSRYVDMVTWKDNVGMSPLDMAIQQNNRYVFLKLLLVSKELVESYLVKQDLANILLEVISEGNSEMVEKFLDLGADPRACDSSGRTPLHYASMVEDDHIAFDLAMLILGKCTSEEEEKIWVEKKDDSGETALHVAAMKGHASLCHVFCNINIGILRIKDADGRGLIYEVVERSEHDNPQVITMLLERGEVQVESIIDHSDLTLVHVAVLKGKTFIADALIKMLGEAKKKYLSTPDMLGQTALHKAAQEGFADAVTILLHHGAHPLLERDSDGRTALHFAVQNQSDVQAIAVAELLLKKCGSDEKKLLLLWASAAGLGTADQRLSDSLLKRFLVQQKKDITEKLRNEGMENNLLRIAARLGDIAMTKELLTRGAQIGDIRDQRWINSLNSKERNNVDTVRKQIRIIAEQGNDQPTISDNLGRSHLAHGLAALLLNPYLKPPITVGISGSWGMGKSSLMSQTEGILLKTAAQLALLPSDATSSSFPGIQILELTKKGGKRYQEIKTIVDLLHKEKELEKNLFLVFKNKISKCCMNVTNKISKWWMSLTKNEKPTYREKGDSLSKFLNQYEADYHHIFKSLAAMDSRYMFKPKDQQSQSEIDSSTLESVPAILTVRYNAWKYMNESEALAGMAVEITKAMEGIMTDAQWLSTCLRNTWRKQKQFIWIEIIFPCLLVVLLAISFTLIVWVLLDRYNIKESVELKYASLPLTVVITAWTLAKKVMSTVNPVSAQLMNYMKLPDHTEKLGYQERVIDDINFLKEEISKKPCFPCTIASYIWHFIISLLSSKYRGESLASFIPSGNLRTIVFVDDIDRCQETVILQVLSAINLVLAGCQISVVLGMDKALIQQAIMNKYEDKFLIQRAIMEMYEDKSLKKCKQLADKYLQKIIQLPLDLPDPSKPQSKNFLNRHLGVFQPESKEGHSELEKDAEDDCIPEINAAYDALFLSLERSDGPDANFGGTIGLVIPDQVPGTEDTQLADTEAIVLDVQQPNETNSSNSRQTGPIQTLWKTVVKVAACMQCINLFKTGRIQTNHGTEPPEETNVAEGDQSLNDLIPIRQMLFMTYSKGEQNVFDYFQEMATDIRKLPREWKRLLNYHRLVWNIFLINNEAKHLDGWQVQLITWIFICWEWEENINIIIENWERLRALEEVNLLH